MPEHDLECSLPQWGHLGTAPNTPSKFNPFSPNPLGLDFSTLSPDLIQRQNFKRGDFIYRLGQDFTSLFRLYGGFAKSETVSVNGQHQILRFIIPGDSFGMKGFTYGQYQSTTVALTDCTVLAVNYVANRAAKQSDQALSRSINRRLTDCLLVMENHLLSFSCYSINQKLAKFLIDFQHRLVSIKQDHVWIDLPMSRDDLKSYLGMTLESLSRAFSGMEKSGYFKVQNRMITEIDFSRLQRFLNDD